MFEHGLALNRCGVLVINRYRQTPAVGRSRSSFPKRIPNCSDHSNTVAMPTVTRSRSEINLVQINLRRLVMVVLSSLVLPMGIAILVDVQLGWMPLLTIGAAIILIPLSSFLVIRMALAELERVVQVVAPSESDNQMPNLKPDRRD